MDAQFALCEAVDMTTNGNFNKLLPCPFCGAHLPDMWSQTLDGVRHTIKCTECPGRAEFFSSRRDQAIAAWNRRAQLEAKPAAPAAAPLQQGEDLPTAQEVELATLAAAHYCRSDDDIPALIAFERYRLEQVKIPGMPGLSGAIPNFIAGYRAALANTRAAAPAAEGASDADR
jgi:hypothetical protein